MKRILPVFLLPFLVVGLLPAPAPTQDKPAPPKHGRGYVPAPPAVRKAYHDAAKKRHGDLMALLAKRVTPPAVFDTVTMGWSPPVVDQGQCGDCFGVSSSDACTAAFIKGGWGKNDGSFKISDQFGLDCKAYEGGCNGGDEAQVIAYMKDKGFPAEKYKGSDGSSLSDYGPYQGRPGSCQLKPGAKLWQLKDWGYVAGDQGQGPAGLAEYKAALMTYGQLSIALDASSFDSYSGGVITNLGNSIDHAISCVGWDDGKQFKMKTPEGNEVTATGAIHCRNNWGTSWGEQGYCWIAYSAVPQIVEPIWLLAPTVTPPTPPPVPPVPPPVPPGPTPVPPVPPVPPTPGTVTIPLTSDQVASVNAQSGALVVTGSMTLQQLVDQVNKGSGVIHFDKGMTLEQLMEAIGKAKAAPAPHAHDDPPKDDRMKKLEADMKQTREALDAIMKALLKDKP